MWSALWECNRRNSLILSWFFLLYLRTSWMSCPLWSFLSHPFIHHTLSVSSRLTEVTTPRAEPSSAKAVRRVWERERWRTLASEDALFFAVFTSRLHPLSFPRQPESHCKAWLSVLFWDQRQAERTAMSLWCEWAWEHMGSQILLCSWKSGDWQNSLRGLIPILSSPPISSFVHSLGLCHWLIVISVLPRRTNYCTNGNRVLYVTSLEFRSWQYSSCISLIGNFLEKHCHAGMLPWFVFLRICKFEVLKTVVPCQVWMWAHLWMHTSVCSCLFQ